MNRVVVTGMGAITPLGCKVDAFLENIENGVCGIGEITRFDTSGFTVKYAGEVKDFTPAEYMEKSEIRRSDKFVQYAVCAAAQAVEDSKIVSGDNVKPGRFGVYFGSGIGGFDTFITEHNNLINRGWQRVSPLFIPKMISNIAAGTIAIRMKAKGPCLSFSTACATGTTAIGEAYRAIKGGYADVIVAGGSEASISPLAVAGFTNCMALSESESLENASIPFDKRRNGFVMGEGAGAMVLESYEHAIARGAKIYAEVSGYGSTCDAFHITAPDEAAEAPAEAIKECVETSGEMPDFSEIYFNAHGTSTPLHDKTETLALKGAFGDNAYKIHISSTKSMTGHLLGAAGAVEAIVAVDSLLHDIVPPTIGYRESDPDCDLDITPNKAVKTKISLALSNSLGFGGHNACIGFKKI